MKRNPSLERKTAARIAAVQCLYQVFLGEEAAPSQLVVRALEMHEGEEGDSEFRLPAAPDKKLLTGIVTGAVEQRPALEAALAEALPGHWRGERLTPLLKAIVLAAAYELTYQRELKPAIVLDEYTTIAAAFFGEQETRLVNGLLQGVASTRTDGAQDR